MTIDRNVAKSIPHRTLLRRRIIALLASISLFGWVVGRITGAFEPINARTGILFQSTLSLGHAFERSVQMVGGGVYLLNPLLVLAAPVYLVESVVLSPCYDIVCIPRDLYIRTCRGFSVSAVDADGTPIPGIGLSATILRLGGMLQRFPDQRSTDRRGDAYFPFYGDFLNVELSKSTVERSGRFFVGSALSPGRGFRESRRMTVVAMKRGVSYAPCLHERVVPLDFLDEARGVSVDLTTGTATVLGAGSRKEASQISPFSLDFRWEADLLTFGVVAEGGARNGILVKADREPKLPSGFSNRLEHVAFVDSFQRIQHDVRRNVGYEKGFSRAVSPCMLFPRKHPTHP